MNLTEFKKLNFPDTPGVYFFKKGRGKKAEILYIGKATSLRDRVKSYFSNDLIRTRGRLLVDMITQATTVEYEKADSVLEAFIREFELIKQHMPRYNTKEKDNKSFNYVVITKEEYPRVLVVRGRNLELSSSDADILDFEYTDAFGPYPFGAELKEALKLIRKIFPYRDKCQPNSGRPCFNASIGLCPGVCDGTMSKKEYLRQIRNIRYFFQGKKKAIMEELTKQMKEYAKAHEFEKANDVKRTMQALTHIQDISMIKKDAEFGDIALSKNFARRHPDTGVPAHSHDGEPVLTDDSQLIPAEAEIAHNKIEAYDIAHLSGKDMVGVLVVLEDGEFNKNEYKKFNIKTLKGSDDTAALTEVLERRLNHPEWQLPGLMVIDGGRGQLSAVEKVFKARDVFGVSLVSVVKDDKHKAREVLRSETYPPHADFDDNDAIRINQESHRFAVAAHTKRRAISRGLNIKRKREF